MAIVKEFQTKVGKQIEDFLYEKGKRSKDTETAYRSDIGAFLKAVYGKAINTITAEELELLDYDSLKDYLNSLDGIKSNNAINRYYSSIKSMYRELNIRKAIVTELTMFDLINTLPANANSYESIPMEVALQYIEAVKYEKHKVEEKRMIIKLAIDSGLRESELRALEWKQFKPDGKYVYITGFGKGNKKFVEKMSRKLYDELLTLKVEGQSKVFTLSKKNLGDMMIRLKNVLNHTDRNYTFHSFKKTAVTNTYKFTGSFTEAQKKGKHSNPATTQLYLEEEEMKMTGYFSLEGNIDHEKYKKVSHEELIRALESANKELLFTLNLKLQ